MLTLDRKDIARQRIRNQLTPVASGQPVIATLPEPADPLPTILEKITALLSRKPVEQPAPPPVDNSDICSALAEIKKTLSTAAPKRRFEFKFNRDQHDFITSIEVTEL